jgi:hypothetical protein
VLSFCRAITNCDMDWIGEIEKHAGAAGRPTIFKEAMTTLSFRLEEGLKEDVNLLAEYLTRRLKAKSSAGAVARAFIASGLEQMRTQYPDLRKFLEQQRIENNGGKVPVAKEKSLPKESVRAGRGRKK